MQTSEHGRRKIAEHEGEILEVYLDPIGLPTLGVGHLLTKAELAQMPVGTKITKAQSDAYLAKDLARFERCVAESCTVPPNQNQFDALVSLAFNIGEANFKRSSVLRYHNDGRFSAAANAFLMWDKARKKGQLVRLPGLTKRRKAERELYIAE